MENTLLKYFKIELQKKMCENTTRKLNAKDKNEKEFENPVFPFIQSDKILKECSTFIIECEKEVMIKTYVQRWNL